MEQLRQRKPIVNSLIRHAATLGDRVVMRAGYGNFPSSALKAYADWRVGATSEEKHAFRSSDNIVLTFDDYGEPDAIKQLLRTLNLHNIKAMFFVQGDWADENILLVTSIARAGHIVGNHTYSHQDLLSLSDAQIRQEISQGVPSQWLRPPMGRYSDRIRRIAGELGMSIVYWTVDSDDWKGVSAEYMKSKILRQIHPGAVILFHMHAQNTIDMLPELISAIRSRGYQFEPLRPERVRA